MSYLDRDLLDATNRPQRPPAVSSRHFSVERVRALVGAILYAAAGLIGYVVAPLAGLVIFVVLPVFYAVTSAGLLQVPLMRRIAHHP